jgi:hypothetical protein
MAPAGKGGIAAAPQTAGSSGSTNVARRTQSSRRGWRRLGR